MLTTRDVQVLDFLKEFKIARTSQIAEIYFPSKLTCQRRLMFLYKNKHIKRMKIYSSVNEEYLYYITMPKQLKHALTLTNFYSTFRKDHKIVDFRVQPKLGSVIPDAMISYIDRDGKTGVAAALEIELSHKKIDLQKYLKWQASGEYMSFLPYMPRIMILTDKVPVQDKRLNLQYIPLSQYGEKGETAWVQ